MPGSTYVLGFGGTGEFLGGMTYVSHIIPPAVTLLAFMYADRPAVSGALLAAAAGLGFYPAFFFPAWLAYQWSRSTNSALRFTAGFVGVSPRGGRVGVIGVTAGATARASSPRSCATHSGHHTDLEGYGSSTFGLWGQQTGVLRWMLQPLSGDVGAVVAVLPPVLRLPGRRRRCWRETPGLVGLALITATVAMGANIWKIHATATYVTWYYPFLLLGTLGPGALVRRPSPHALDERKHST